MTRAETRESPRAISCVEAGVDFSFRTAFRESRGPADLLQAAGRANRGGGHPDAGAWHFRHDESGFVSLNPHFKISRKVLAGLFAECGATLGPQHCTEALRRDIDASFGEPEGSAPRVAAAERNEDHPQAAQDCRLIAADTNTLLVSQDLIARFLTFDPQQFPTPQEVMRYSVQVRRNKPPGLPVTRSLRSGAELVGIQPECYDTSVGCMKGLIPLPEAQSNGGFVL